LTASEFYITSEILNHYLGNFTEVQLKKLKDDLQENLEQFVVAELTCSRFVRGEVGVTLLTDCESNTDFFRVCNPSAPIKLSFEYTAEEVDALPEQLHFPNSFKNHVAQRGHQSSLPVLLRRASSCFLVSNPHRRCKKTKTRLCKVLLIFSRSIHPVTRFLKSKSSLSPVTILFRRAPARSAVGRF
jgi:hypothetical protein